MLPATFYIYVINTAEQFGVRGLVQGPPVMVLGFNLADFKINKKNCKEV